MKKVLLSLLAAVLILGALGAAGFAGYQYGYREGALAAADGNVQLAPWGRKFDTDRMPMFRFERGFDREFGPGGFGMMHRGIGFGFFSPLIFLARLAFWGLVIWAAYMLIARSGWRLTRTEQVTQTTPTTSTTQTEVKEETE